MISHTDPNTVLNSLMVDGIRVNIHVYLQILQTVHKIYNWQMYSGRKSCFVLPMADLMSVIRRHEEISAVTLYYGAEWFLASY